MTILIFFSCTPSPRYSSDFSNSNSSNKETKKGLAAFEKTITAINAGEYKEASKHMLWNYNDDGSITKTKWNAQLPKDKRTGLNRAERLSKLMANIFVDN